MDLLKIRSELNSGKSIRDLPLRVTFYARVSTESDEQANSLENQISYYKKMINKIDNWTYVDGYIDKGISGKSTKNRDAFIRMVEDAKSDNFDFIITKEISRFSRNTLDSVKYTQELLENGVGVLFENDNINTLFTDSELRLTIMSSIAQDEIRRLSERVTFGMKESQRKGYLLGNNSIWGYEKQDGKLVINEDEANFVRTVFNLYANNTGGVKAVIDELEKMGFKNRRGGSRFPHSTIVGIIRNPKYKGYYCANKIKTVNYKTGKRKKLDNTEWISYNSEDIPAIVDEQLWNRANDKLEKNRKKRISNEGYQSRYSYSQKIICMQDGATFHRGVMYKGKPNEKEYWKCRISKDRGKIACSTPILYTEDLDKILHNVYNQLIENKEQLVDEMVKVYMNLINQSKEKDNTKNLDNKVKEINIKKDRLLELNIESVISNLEFKVRNDKLNDELEEIELQIANIKVEEPKQIYNESELKKMILKKLNFTDGFNVELVNSLLEKIEVNKIKEDKYILKIYLKGYDSKLNYIGQLSDSGTSFCELQQR